MPMMKMLVSVYLMTIAVTPLLGSHAQLEEGQQQTRRKRPTSVGRGFLKITGRYVDVDRKLLTARKNQVETVILNSNDSLKHCFQRYQEIPSLKLKLNFEVGEEGTVVEDLNTKRHRTITNSLIFHNYFYSWNLNKDASFALISAMEKLGACIWAQLKNLKFGKSTQKVEFILGLRSSASGFSFFDPSRSIWD